MKSQAMKPQAMKHLAMKRRTMLLGCVALAGCSSAPVRSYQLAPVAGAIRGGTGERIVVRSIAIPSALGQNGLPKPGGVNDANGFDNDVWAAPLAGMLQATMVQNLAQRLPGDDVLSGGGAIGAPPDIYVEINVLAFAPDPNGNIALQAQLATRHATAQDWQFKNFTASATDGLLPEGIAAAMSTLWGQAADAVAGMV
jgi:uncharacterized lipoprotein YmbA